MADERGTELARLRRALLDEATLGDVVDTLVAHTARLLGGVRAGVVVVRRGERVESGSTDPALSRLEALQRCWGAGPDLDLLAGHDPVLLVPDISGCERWQRWARAAGRHGLRSMVGVRLRTPNGSLGSLTCYAAVPRHFGAAHLATLRSIGHVASPTLATSGERDRLWDAVDARRMIAMGEGVLMEAYGVDGQQAAAVLSRQCRERRLTPHAFAGQLVATMALPG